MALIGYYISAFVILLLPLYLWGYGMNTLGQKTCIRSRFWAGVLSGILSVLFVYWITHTSTPLSFGENIAILTLFFSLLYLCIFGATFFGSAFIRVFLQKITFWHSVGIFGFLVLLFFLSFSFPYVLGWLPLVIPFFIMAMFEETTKHLFTLGLLGKNFQFSQRELVFFTFFVVLGFTFFENILYIRVHDMDIATLFLRTTFPLATHLLTALICTWAWWKALAYPFYSFRYFACFFSGFFVATFLHALYNIEIQSGHFVLPFFYCVCTYFLFVFLIRE